MLVSSFAVIHTSNQLLTCKKPRSLSVPRSKITSIAVLHTHHGTLSSTKELDIINAHLMVARAKEEMLLLEAEMFNPQMYLYYKNMSDLVEAAIRGSFPQQFH